MSVRIEDLEKSECGNIAYFYQAYGYRWEESCNPIIEDQETFLSEDLAKEYLKNLSLSIGFRGIVSRVEISLEELLESEFNEDGCVDLDMLSYKTLSHFEATEIFDNGEFDGDSIVDSIIISWSWEKHVGYCRNLMDIGIAGEGFFGKFLTEKDLITGNEESTFSRNYSVLLTKQEVEEADDIQEAINDALNQGNWKWNCFKDNPKSAVIQDKIQNLLTH